MERLEDYLSCEVKFSKGKKRDWLGQPQLIKNLAKMFGNHVKNVQSHKTPGMPKLLIVRFMIKSKNISADQHEYMSGVGILLYLIKHLQPDIANVTRELSKANNSVNPEAFKELLCVINHVLDTKNLELKIEPTRNANKPWEIVYFSDSDYAGDPVSRRSISDFILYVLRVPVSWHQRPKRVCHFLAQKMST